MFFFLLKNPYGFLAGKVSDFFFFQVKETGEVAIAGAYVDLTSTVNVQSKEVVQVRIMNGS